MKLKVGSLITALILASSLPTDAPSTAERSQVAGPEVIRVWPGQAPRTEDWTGDETSATAPGVGGNMHIISNITVPMLTRISPVPGKANGTTVVVLPGGGFQALVWDIEGIEVAHWLAARGITAFVLKYRVRPSANPYPPTSDPDEFERLRLGHPKRAIAAADGAAAIKLLRRDAARFGIDPHRIGMMGFSAGAMTTMAIATGSDLAARPDFAISVYGATFGDRADDSAPPLFIVAAGNDASVPPGMSIKMFQSWKAAKRPVELHLYEEGGHGFGMRETGKPVDAWPAVLEAWLKQRRLI